ncbi:MAG: DinB family protein [Segetibacter sp.]
MQHYNTRKLIDELQQQTETFLEKAVLEWQIISPAKLLRQPATDKWSFAQCLDHLNSYGHYYLSAIEKTIETAKQKNWTSRKVFTPGLLGNYFTKLMAPAVEGTKMKKMSAPKNHIPIADLDSREVLSEFIQQQEKLILPLEEARKINLEKAKVPISIARFIKLQLGDTFRFLIMHNIRHILQGEGAIEAAAITGEERSEIAISVSF